jgi:hypothetical protein
MPCRVRVRQVSQSQDLVHTPAIIKVAFPSDFAQNLIASRA